MRPTDAHLLDRQVRTITTVPHSRLNLSVLQWNALARCYATQKHYPFLPLEAFQFDHRKDRLSSEIKSYNPDIICLQEVDYRDSEFFKTLYSDESYSFNFVKKPHSKDGTCIMLKKPLQVIETEAVEHFNKEKNRIENLVSQLVVAKCPTQDGDSYLIVATCHLKANTPEGSFSDTRTMQAQQLMAAIQKKKEKCLEGNKEGNVMVIVCGDFNDGPESAAAKEFVADQEIGLKGVFDNEEYTLYQRYGNSQFYAKSVVDHVLYSKNLVLTKKVGGPEEGKVGNDGLLSEEFPSDHLSLYCELSLPGK